MLWCMERRTQMTRTNGNGDGATAVHIALQGRGGVGKSMVSSSVGWELGELGSEITRKNPSTQPTIKVTVGFRFDVRMNSGMLLETPCTHVGSYEALEQLLRVMYISHAWTATELRLQESQSKESRNRAQTSKRSFWSLQCPALKCPRQAPAG